MWPYYIIGLVIIILAILFTDKQLKFIEAEKGISLNWVRKLMLVLLAIYLLLLPYVIVYGQIEQVAGGRNAFV